MVWPMVAGVASSAGAASSIIGGINASKKAKAAGKANARLIMAETQEQLRRTERQFDQVYGQTRAMIGASGVTFSGTPTKYLQDMKTEQGLQLDWLAKSGRMRAKAAKKQGSYIGSSAMSQGIIGGLQGIQSAAGYFAQSQTPPSS